MGIARSLLHPVRLPLELACMQRLNAFMMLLLLLGCDHNEKDSHTEVFKTSDQARSERAEKQLQAHKELAVSVLKFSRPDIKAVPAEGTSITVQSDSVSRTIDLLPIEEQLVKQPNEQRAILRKFLAEKLRSFDVDHLKQLGFDAVKSKAGYQLVNARDLAEMQAAAGKSPLIREPIVSNVYRVAVIRTGDQAVPVTAEMLESWHGSASVLDHAIQQNLREVFSQARGNFMETSPFGPVGQIGSIKTDVDPAIILLPEFLSAVRENWKTSDNLVLFVPAPAGILFVEEHNQKLLDIVVPQWRKQLVAGTNPLSEQLLLRTPGKISYAEYTPTSKPATMPTTKPAPYFVH
jgi:hypothetical protein